MSEGWVCSLTAVASNGNVTQLYPAWCSVGTARSTATPAQEVREPTSGEMTGLQVKTDDTNGGLIELWDVSGVDCGAEVSSAATITNAQLAAAITAGTAKLIYSQNFVGSGVTPPSMGYIRFLKGLAARFSNSGPTGTCSLNIKVSGGYRKIHGSV